MGRRKSRSSGGKPANATRLSHAEKKQMAQEHVRSEALQHPATILPGAGGLVAAGAAVVMISTAPAAAVAAGVIGVGLLFAGGASYVWRRVAKGPQSAEEYVEMLNEQEKQQEALDAAYLEDELRAAGFAEGAKEAGELRSAYEKAQRTLDEHFKEGNSSAERFRMLAEDAYREGISILTQALGRFKALSSVDIKALQREHKQWSKELEKLEEGDASTEPLRKQIESHTRRIEAYEAHEAQLRLLIAESNDLEAALENVSLQAYDLSSGGESALFGTGSAATRLERAVGAARRVEERLSGIGNGMDKDLEDELRAAARSRE